jgi:phytanoyl-CoA dioxygenase PhyH
MASRAPNVRNEVEHEDFWRERFPNLHICELLTEDFRNSIVAAPPPNTVALNAERMRVDAYFQGRDETAARLAPVLADAVRTCKKLEISPLFLFLFDEAWQCFYSLHQQLAPFLGDYKMLPAFWVWHVDPTEAEAGWPPHRDKGRHALDADGNPLALTAWIPLSEATPLSSCVYILPKSRDPVYGTEDEQNWQVDYPSIRALPAQPGEFYCWDQAVLHWGSASSRFAESPRISMALEFQRSDIEPFVKPLLPALCNPDFRVRLWLVTKHIMEHRLANQSQSAGSGPNPA